jgi:hypothetical protein
LRHAGQPHPHHGREVVPLQRLFPPPGNARGAQARGGRRAPAKGQRTAAISTAAISTAAISTAVTAVVHNTTVRGGTERVARRSEVRGRDYATNVLTFDGVREAGVPVPAHCAHLVVHGVLHTRAGL